VPLPSWMEVNSKNHLTIAGVDLVELAEKYGTPLYVYNEDLIRSQCRLYREELARHYPRGEIIYAGKAFLTLAMCRLLQQEGLSLDVVSGGELYTAIQAGFPMERVYFHGNNKSDAELALAVKVGVGRIVVDSFMELERLNREAERQGKQAEILLRVKPGIAAHTHHYIQTGQEDSKFGLGISDGQALEGIKLARALPNLVLRGLHCHIGSQIMTAEPFCLAAETMMDFMQSVRAATGVLLQELDLGGGLGIRYTGEDEPCGISDLLPLLARTVKEKAREHAYPYPKLMLEPGRSIVGEAGVTLYTVGTIKDIPGVRKYISVDGGMMDNLRTALYGARYEAVLANRARDPAAETVTVAGKACESGDILIRDLALPPVSPGDLLLVFSTGAYHFSMYSQYNRNPRPAVVFLRRGKAELVVRRESYQDLINLDCIPAHLREDLASPGAVSDGKRRGRAKGN